MSKAKHQHSKHQIGQEVDQWIHETDMPARANIKPIRQFDSLYNFESEEEREAYYDFIHWAVTREHQLLMSIPTDEPDGFCKLELDENGDDISAFASMDYIRTHPWNSYHWRLKQACKKAKDLAIAYSVVKDEEAKKRIMRRFITLARTEYKRFFAKVFKVWNQYAYIE